MDSIPLSTLATIVGILGFGYTYIKDRVETAKSLGRLEQRVENLEHTQRVLEDLTRTLTDARLAISRLETKVDTLSAAVARNARHMDDA